jgi:Ca-activated chloride channel homolog
VSGEVSLHWLRRSGVLSLSTLLGAVLLVAPAQVQSGNEAPSCTSDAMIVFDASGSMAGMGFGETTVSRLQQVRHALAEVLPDVAPFRKLGLLTFGPGKHRACDNIDLKFTPIPNAMDRILSEINALHPYGQTPITKAVSLAANAVDYRDRPVTIVLLTDGEEDCGGDPCALAQQLKTKGAGVTVHIISYMLSHLGGLSTGGSVRCLSEATDGLYIATETTDELISALRRTLSCPVISGLAKAPSSTSSSRPNAGPS